MHKTIALQNFDDDLLPLLSNADDRQEKCAYAFRKFSIESPRGQKYSERANDHRLIFCLCDSHALVRNIDLGALEVQFPFASLDTLLVNPHAKASTRVLIWFKSNGPL